MRERYEVRRRSPGRWSNRWTRAQSMALLINAHPALRNYIPFLDPARRDHGPLANGLLRRGWHGDKGQSRYGENVHKGEKGSKTWHGHRNDPRTLRISQRFMLEKAFLTRPNTLGYSLLTPQNLVLREVFLKPLLRL